MTRSALFELILR